MMNSNFDDVGEFHEKFDLRRVEEGTLTNDAGPAQVDRALLEFRRRFLQEEVDEFTVGVACSDPVQMFDALLDIVYVAMGTAHLLGFPWQEGWDEVQRSNMQKERATEASQSKRGSTWDVVKPEDWEPPDLKYILRYHGWDV